MTLKAKKFSLVTVYKITVRVTNLRTPYITHESWDLICFLDLNC